MDLPASLIVFTSKMPLGLADFTKVCKRCIRHRTYLPTSLSTLNRSSKHRGCENLQGWRRLFTQIETTQLVPENDEIVVDMLLELQHQGGYLLIFLRLRSQLYFCSRSKWVLSVSLTKTIHRLGQELLLGWQKVSSGFSRTSSVCPILLETDRSSC